MKTQFKIRSLLFTVTMIAFALLTLFPFFWLLSTSFKPNSEIASKIPSLFPANPTLKHYQALFQSIPLLHYYANSFFVSLSVMIISLIVDSMAAYAFAKLNFPYRDRIFAVLILTLLVPSQVTMIPVFFILKSFGLLNTLSGLALRSAASVFSIFMVRQFMLEIPNELIEAARIDGLSELRIFWRIIIPLSTPVLATLAVMNFIGSWNDFIWPLILMRSPDSYTLPVALANMNNEYGVDWGILMAGGVLVMIPTMAIFIILQRYYVRGITAGGVKG